MFARNHPSDRLRAVLTDLPELCFDGMEICSRPSDRLRAVLTDLPELCVDGMEICSRLTALGRSDGLTDIILSRYCALNSVSLSV